MPLRDTVLARLQASGNHSRWVLVAALVGMFATTFPTTILAVSLATIAGDFGVSDATIAWLVSLPLLLSAMALPLLGKMGDLHGHRRVFLAGFLAATVTTAASALAWSAWSLISLRTLSAIVGAATQPSSLALIFLVFPRHERTRAIGWWSMVAAGAPTLGLAVGGPLVDLFGWRVLFLVQAGLSILALAFAWLVLTETATKRVRFDLAGAAALTVGVSGLMIAISRLREDPITSPILWACVLAGILGLAAFIAIERRIVGRSNLPENVPTPTTPVAAGLRAGRPRPPHESATAKPPAPQWLEPRRPAPRSPAPPAPPAPPTSATPPQDESATTQPPRREPPAPPHADPPTTTPRPPHEPLLPLELFRLRNFSAPIVANTLQGAAYMGSFVMAPLVLLGPFALTVTQTSAVMLARTLSLSLGSPLGGRLGERAGARPAALIGSGLMTLSFGLSAWGVLESSLLVLGTGLVLLGLGQGLCRPSLLASIASAGPDEHVGIASATARLTRQVGGSFGVTALTLVYAAPEAGGAPTPERFATAFLAGAGFCAASVAVSALLESTPIPTAQDVSAPPRELG